MSNIDKIKAEIERLKKILEESTYYLDNSQQALGYSFALDDFKEFIDSLPEETKNHGCGVEFPHFGANYPDAKCIDGYLWDMDSYEDGVYTIGGDDPCPICNTEEWLKDVLDDEIFKTRDEALEYVKMLKSKYKHKDSLPEEKPSDDLEEAAKEYMKKARKHLFDDSPIGRADDAFKAGAEWQKEQVTKDAVEGVICYGSKGAYFLRLPRFLKQWIDKGHFEVTEQDGRIFVTNCKISTDIEGLHQTKA